MTPETWWTSIGIAASLFLEVVLTGVYLSICRQRSYRSRHRTPRSLDELSGQFRVVAGFLERYRDLGDPKQRHSTS
jgi:hypothetical protein